MVHHPVEIVFTSNVGLGQSSSSASVSNSVLTRLDGVESTVYQDADLLRYKLNIGCVNQCVDWVRKLSAQREAIAVRNRGGR
mgnify:FL=1